MSGAWLASYIALWAVVLFQGAVIFLLVRQLGIIYLGTAQGVSRDGIAVGSKAPDFSVHDLGGREVSLGGLLEKHALVIFGSATCRPCRELIPDLNGFARDHRQALNVLFLCYASEEDARRFAEETVAQVPVGVYQDESLADAYKARVTPFAFVIDREGVVRAKGLANNRAHLDMLWQAARGEPKADTNGTHAQREELEKAI